MRINGPLHQVDKGQRQKAYAYAVRIDSFETFFGGIEHAELFTNETAFNAKFVQNQFWLSFWR
jgi:hypothetical protein